MIGIDPATRTQFRQQLDVARIEVDDRCLLAAGRVIRCQRSV
jgi:hypothetical protein